MNEESKDACKKEGKFNHLRIENAQKFEMTKSWC